MTTDDPVELDELYGVTPQEFTALRTTLVAAARKRGDVEVAKRIAAARRPTTAAWVVNWLVRSDGSARGRLRDLGEKLREAHATMDGAQIRELSTAQRKLVEELTRAGFAAAEISAPSAALRDDVVATLQAAIADHDVESRLGRLVKGERWSGFGEFGAVSAVGAGSGKVAKARAPATKPRPMGDEVATARERVAAAQRDVESAELLHAEALDVLTDRSAKLATARRRYEKILDTLSAAERELNAADADRADAEQAVGSAADRFDAAKSVLTEAESDLAAIAAE